MKKNTLAISLLALLSIVFVGCKTTDTVEKKKDTKHNLNHIETKNRYMLSSELPKEGNIYVAVVNIVLPSANSSTVAAELTFGSFKPRENGKVYIQSDAKTVRYQSMTELVNAISIRSMDPPIGIFMLVDGVALGTDAAPDADVDVMTFTRELDSLLADENIQQVYLIPDSFSISYK